MRSETGRPPYRPVMRCMVSQAFVYLRTMQSIVGPDPVDILLVSALGWMTGAETTFPTPDETEDEAERLLAIRRPEPLESLARRVALSEAATRSALHALEARGLVLSTEDGYLAAPTLLHGAAMERIRREVFVGVAAFLDELAKLGVQLPQAAIAAHETRRRVARLAMRLYLDGGVPDFMRQMGWSAQKTMVFIGICDANYDTVRSSRELAEPLARKQGVIPDELRRPATRTALARRLGYSRTITSRLADELLAEGWLEARPRGGLIAPGRVLVGEDVGAVAQRAWDAMVEFVQSVHRVGMPMPRTAWGRRSGGVHQIPAAP